MKMKKNIKLESIKIALSSLLIVTYLLSITTQAKPVPVMVQNQKSDAEEIVNKIPVRDLTLEDFLPYQEIDYKIAVGDVMEIMVFGHQDTFVEAVPIAPDGYLYYMFCDPIEAVGRSVEEVRAEITTLVEPYFSNPEIAIILKHRVQSSYLILGKVRTPGEYSLEAATSLRQAIAEAGGLSRGFYRGFSVNIAALANSFIVRDEVRLNVDFKTLLENPADNNNDIYLRPGDYVYIASSLAEEVFILGAVEESKAAYYSEGLTLTGLLAGGTEFDSGGYLPSAHLKKIIILRGDFKSPTIIEVNYKDILKGKTPDVYLMAGDVIYVPNKPFLFTRKLVNLAMKSFARSFGGDAGAYVADEYLFNDK